MAHPSVSLTAAASGRSAGGSLRSAPGLSGSGFSDGVQLPARARSGQ